MPITKLTLENFKGVGKRVEIPLRPITLLFGANSAGKSTILQALLFFRHLLNHGEPDADRIEGGDDCIRLGGFPSFVHGGDLDRIVTIGVEVPVDADGLTTYVATDTDGRYVDEVELALARVERVSVELSTRWDAASRASYLCAWRIQVDGRTIAEVQGLAGAGASGHLTFLDLDHPAIGAEPDDGDSLASPCFGDRSLGLWVEEIRDALAEADQYTAPSGGDNYYRDNAEFLRQLFGREHLYPGPFPFVAGEGVPWVIPPAKYLGASFSTDATECPALSSLLRHLFLGSRELLLGELDRLRYIGPSRIVPEFAELGSAAKSRWSDGALAWHRLDDAEVVERTNKALAGPNGIGLGFRVERCLSVALALDGEEWSWLHRIRNELAQGNLDFDAAESLGELIARIEALPQTFRIDLIDETTGQRRRPADVGVGVSYVIPVVVGTIATGYSTLLVEQPELHIHPAVQCALGDVLAREVVGS